MVNESGANTHPWRTPVFNREPSTHIRMHEHYRVAVQDPD